MTSHEKSSAGNEVLYLEIKDKYELYQLYMPYIKEGALFVGTEKLYYLGDNVSLTIKLINDAETYLIQGKVIWITPPCAQGGRAAGIGLQFIGSKGQEARHKIETYLAGMHHSDQPTHTL